MPERHPSEHEDDDRGDDEDVEEEKGEKGIHGVEDWRARWPEG